MTEHYCEGCFKYDKKAKKCIAFKELYPQWDDYDEEVDCWGRETDPRGWKKTLDDIEEHYQTFLRDNKGMSPAQKRWVEYTRLQRPKLQRAINKIEDKEIEQAMMEDRKRGKPGGGEKNMDGSSFGPQQMKDNRFPHRKNNPKKYNGWW